MASWKRKSAYLGILSGLIFVVVTFIAMLTFPGGYLFFDYPFSALGLTVINSTPSMLNYYLFVTACTGAAICYVPQLLALRTLFTDTTLLKILGGLGAILGIAAAPNLSMLAIFAGNLYPAEHGFSTLLFFLLITLGILFMSIAMFLNSEYPRLFASIGIVVVIICFLHVGAFFGFMGYLFGTAIWQKVSVYALVLWSAFQGNHLLHVFE